MRYEQVGPEIRLNTEVDGPQFGVEIAGLANDAFLATYIDGPTGSLFLSGTTPEFVLEPTDVRLFIGGGGDLAIGDVVDTDLATGPGDTVAAAYQIETLDGRSRIELQVLTPDPANPGFRRELGVDFQDRDETSPSVVVLPNGTIAAAWVDIEQADPFLQPGPVVKAQIFRTDGTPVTGEILVQDNGFADLVGVADIGLTANGGFIVAYFLNGNIATRTYSPTGVALGQAESAYFSGFGPSSVEISQFGDRSVISQSEDIGREAGAQVLDRDGTVTMLDVDSFAQRNFTAAALPDGSLIVAYSADDSLRVQVFDEELAPVGAAIEVTRDTSGENPPLPGFRSDLAVRDDGSFAIAWTDSRAFDGDSSMENVRAKLYAPVVGLSLEEAQTVALLYEAGLDRNGNIDLPGLNFWIDQREAGLSVLGLAAFFLDSDEFQASAEALLADGTDLTDANVRDGSVFSNEDYVVLLYENVLDREFDVPGRDFWLSVLETFDANPNQSATARERLLLAFAESDENRNGSPVVDTLAEVSPGEWDFV